MFLSASRIPKICLAIALVLIFGIIRFAWIGRITHDEGLHLSVIERFATSYYLQVDVLGPWGQRLSSTGPTVIVPLGLLTKIFGGGVIFWRLAYFIMVGAVFLLATRLAGLGRAATAVVTAGFLLWVYCLPWQPAMNGASINLLANIFGEGLAFGLVLCANLAAASTDLKWRRWFWVFGALALGAKSVSLLGLVVPTLLILRDAQKNRAVSRLGLSGMAAGAAILALWQLWLLYVLGWEKFAYDWKFFVYWLQVGGGYTPYFLYSLLSKWQQLGSSNGVNPYVVTALVVAGLGFALIRPLVPRAQLLMIGGSLGIYLYWYLFLSSRGWMRHVWIAYALIGWLVAVTIARAFEDVSVSKIRKLVSAGTLLLLAAVGLKHGALWTLGPLDKQARWKTQEALAEELREKYPRARYMVRGWRMALAVPFFNDQPAIDAEAYPLRDGDILLCDQEADCDPRIYAEACTPKMTDALIGYCVVNLKEIAERRQREQAQSIPVSGVQKKTQSH